MNVQISMVLQAGLQQYMKSLGYTVENNDTDTTIRRNRHGT